MLNSANPTQRFAPAASFRLAEALGALSLATDLANGYPFEGALRTCLLATEIARELGLDGGECRHVYYAALLRFIACTSYAHEEARAFDGDDIQSRQVYFPVDVARPVAMLNATVRGLAKGAGLTRRIAAVAHFVTHAGALRRGLVATHCDVGMRFAVRLGLPNEVVHALGQVFERWDGKGLPKKLDGASISMIARVVDVAHVAELIRRLHGIEESVAEVRKRGGTQFDPRVVSAFLSIHDRAATASEDSVWEHTLAAEPEPHETVPADRIDKVASAFGDFADLKSVYTLGHSTAVAALAEGAATILALDATARRQLRLAGFLHDVGSVSVPTGVWEKPAALTAAEWERVRLHPYYTERILSRSATLEPIGRICGSHHERLDRSGYPHGSTPTSLTVQTRILAAADTYQALTEARAHRPALDAAAAKATLEAEARAGKLDPNAVAAVLEAAGHRIRRPRSHRPAGLSDREIEVLCALARGRSNKQIASELSISARTVQHHVMHIYDKIQVNSRAAAALFAVEHELLGNTTR